MSKRKLLALGVTENEIRKGLTPKRAAPLLGVEVADSARRLLRENGIPRLARGRYAAAEVLALREARIRASLIADEPVALV